MEEENGDSETDIEQLNSRKTKNNQQDFMDENDFTFKRDEMP